MDLYSLTLLALFAVLGLTVWAQYKVSHNFKEWSKVGIRSGMTGAETARLLLDKNGLQHIGVKAVPGMLTDHYDPVNKVIGLSEGVYGASSISAVSIAAHETGHAIQHKEQYNMLVLRHRMTPVLKFTSGLAPILIIAGILFYSFNLIGIGVIFFATIVAFQLVTLPVEFNASGRARQLLTTEGIISTSEGAGVKKVLDAAALTYVAATLYAVVELFRYIIIFLGMRRN
jgi:Zn-dependent membrane protease YugP